MAVVPCSAGTLGRIAAGVSDSLITRAADVCLKERRPLVLGLRETPLNRIHLENMLRVHDAGAVVMPLMPSFYHHPETLRDLFEAFATRVLDQFGLREEDRRRWGGTPK
jgi:polyprenyl P-hydroxybenzoate/phenylacrylic acid decarboxylase-like protein